MKRKLKKLKRKTLKLVDSAWSVLKENKVSTLHTILLLWICVRIEFLAALLMGLANIIVVIGFNVMISMEQARAQFAGAINSILSLFGADGGA